MSNALDMSLDDLIKNNKKSKPKTGSGNGNPRSRGRLSGPVRTQRFKNRGAAAANRSNPFNNLPRAPDSAWNHDMFVDQSLDYPAQGGRATASIETGTKLLVSNLDFGVSNDDIKELFSEVGDLKRCSIHYDRSGRSEGTAEVVYARRSDAVAAIKKYNNVQLDGKPMKIDIVARNIPAPAPQATFPGNFNGFQQTSGRGASRFRGSKGRGRGSGRGRAPGRGQRENVSAEALDADLEKYHSEAMQIN